MRAPRLTWILGYGFWIFLLLLGCGDDQTSRDDIRPIAPVPVERSRDDVYPQRGIRPEPTLIDNQYRVRIEWQPNPEPDVAGYRIWRRREDESVLRRTIIRDLRFGVNLDRAPTLVFLDAGDDYLGRPLNLLAPDQPEDSISTRGFVWFIEAYDEANNRSLLSDSLYYRLVNNSRSMHVIRQAPGRYSLEWQFDANDDPEGMSYYYMIRVYSATYGTDSVMWHQQVFRYGGQVSVILNNDSLARPFQTDSAYVWQLNVVVIATDDSSRTPAGSAAYTTFVYQD